MTNPVIRILFLADTHLGFDLPLYPRIERRRRGDDFFACYQLALEPALRGEVDLVVHGGDLFFRSRVPDTLVQRALQPLVDVADFGIPVYLVPGNHERSRIPLRIWRMHPNLHIFDQPATFFLVVNGLRLAVAGFPYTHNIREQFRCTVNKTGFELEPADVRILCMHHVVEGAQVGPGNFTFRGGEDVVRVSDIPGDFCAVLSGHIHRSQVLRHDLLGRQMAAPVIYAGSTERTSFAECDEEKHYVSLQVTSDFGMHGRLLENKFHPLPARPMHTIELPLQDLSCPVILQNLKRQIEALEPHSVVRVRVHDDIPDCLVGALSASRLRSLAPASMNIDLALRSRREFGQGL